MSNWTVTPDGLIVFERTRLEAEDTGQTWTHEDKLIEALFSRRFVPVEKLRVIAWRETSRRHDITRRAGRPIFESRSRRREGGASLLDWRMSDADPMIFEQIRTQLVEAIRVGETAIDFLIRIPWLIGHEPRKYRFSAVLESEESRDLSRIDETVKQLFAVYTNGGEYR